jgi:hypothetical protein
MGVGIKSLFGGLGLEIEVQVNTDSSAARSMSSRREVLGEFDASRCGYRRRSEEHRFQCCEEHVIKERCWASSTRGGVGTGEGPKGRVVHYHSAGRGQCGRRLHQARRLKQAGEVHEQNMGDMRFAPTLEMSKFIIKFNWFTFGFPFAAMSRALTSMVQF